MLKSGSKDVRRLCLRFMELVQGVYVHIASGEGGCWLASSSKAPPFFFLFFFFSRKQRLPTTEGTFNPWPWLWPFPSAMAAQACPWLMSITRPYWACLIQKFNRTGLFGWPSLPLFNVWRRDLSFVAVQSGIVHRWVNEQGQHGTAQQSDLYFFKL